MTEEQEKIRYVTFSGRMNATIIDLILSTIALVPLFSAIFTKPEKVGQLMDKLHNGGMSEDEFSAALRQYMLFEGGLNKVIADSLWQFVITGMIFVIFWIYRSATPGKILLSMKIVDVRTNEKPTNIQFAVRYLSYILSSIPLGLGFFWIVFDKKKQGWHDKIAKTVVIYTKPEDADAANKRFKLQTIMVVIVVIVFCSIYL